MLLVEKIAMALVVSRQKQLNIPILVDIWARLPKPIKVNSLKDAMSVLEALKHEDEDLNGADINGVYWLDEAIESGEIYLKEIS